MNYNKTKEELKTAYSNLLELQYYGKEKAVKTVKAHCEIMLANMLLFRMQKECMDVDVSVGVQLDTVGEWVGVDRYFKGSQYENKKWYAYYDWNDSTQPNNLQGGMYDWNTSIVPDAPFITYNWILASKNKLSNGDFRTLIKLKIIKNNINMTAKNIDDAIYELFEDEIKTAWGECMELTYIFPVEKTTIMNLAKEKNILPSPTGVKVNFQTI